MGARLWRIRHDAKLLGWQVTLLQGARLYCEHERGGATVCWPMARDDAAEAVVMQIFRLSVPKAPEAEAEMRRLQRRRRALQLTEVQP